MRLTLGYPNAPAILLGGYQRPCEVAAEPAELPRLQRRTGGGAVRIGPGTLWVQLSLDLGDLPADKLLNRHVRPQLKALTKTSGIPAHYFGRDWVALGHRPAAYVAFAATDEVALLDMIVANHQPLQPRPSFRGKDPVALGVAPERLLDAVVAAYGVEPERKVPNSAPAEDEPPWTATLEEAIGTIAAGPDKDGRLRVGGELMAPLGDIASLESAVATGGDIEEALRGAMMFGARPESLREVITRALRRAPTRALP